MKNQNKFVCKISSFDLWNQSVFLRVDLNVPTIEGKILSDFRLRAIQPTLDLLLNKGSKIVLATHIGKPTKFEESLSTRLLIPWFNDRKYKISFASDIDKALRKINSLDLREILLLENLRFFKGEEENSKLFAQRLRKLAKFYVNDAFGVLHRNQASIVELPKMYSEDHKSVGLLIEKEEKNLSRIKNHPEHPFVLILGGVKIKSKLPLLDFLIDKIDYILLCPAISFTFSKGLSQEVGLSFVNQNMIDQAKKIMKEADLKGVRIHLPRDYLIAKNNKDGSLSIQKIDDFPKNGYGIAIGPETLSSYKSIIKKAKTIFLNGLMGFHDRPETLQPFNQLIKSMADSSNFSVVAGGDSVAAVYEFGLESNIDFCSTGGGSALAYLADKNLPGLKYM